MRPHPECACMVSFIPLDCISLDKLSVRLYKRASGSPGYGPENKNNEAKPAKS